MKVLVTGIAGKLGRRVAELLVSHGHEVIGLDRRDWPDPPAGITLYRHDVRKRGTEEVFRTTRPRAVIHMATVTHLTVRSEERYRINLQGTRAIFDHCHRYGVRSCIFMGRHTYYGAGPEVPLYHREDDPPSSIHVFPELSDLVAADLYAGSALWRYPEINTAVLRVCYTLGPSGHGTLASFLRGPRVPTVLGFDPLFQFLHEADVARAVATTLEKGLRGVFNIAGPSPVPLSILIREAGRSQLPIPEPLFRLALGRFGLPKLPTGALSHIKWPVVMDASRFAEVTGFSPEYGAAEAIADFARIPSPRLAGGRSLF